MRSQKLVEVDERGRAAQAGRREPSKTGRRGTSRRQHEEVDVVLDDDVVHLVERAEGRGFGPAGSAGPTAMRPTSSKPLRAGVPQLVAQGERERVGTRRARSGAARRARAAAARRSAACRRGRRATSSATAASSNTPGPSDGPRELSPARPSAEAASAGRCRMSGSCERCHATGRSARPTTTNASSESSTRRAAVLAGGEHAGGGRARDPAPPQALERRGVRRVLLGRDGATPELIRRGSGARTTS